MGYPYSSGDVLTAADLNASSGLVLVKSQTIGSGVSSVTVTGAFSSTFDNYKILISGGSCTTNANLQCRLDGLTTGYYGGYPKITWSSGALTADVDNNAGRWTYAGNADTNGISASFDLIAPFLSKAKRIVGQGTSGAAAGRLITGYNADTSPRSGLVLSAGSGTMTGGTIRVYGYNNG